jgi:hypothetical protein
MMKKILLIVLTALFLAGSVAFAEIGTVTHKVLVVRSGPSRNQKVIARLKKGEQPLVEGLRGDWVKLAWEGEAWVERGGLSLSEGVAKSSAQDEQFIRWLIHDTKVNWVFIARKGGDVISLWVRMDSDRYGDKEGVTFIAHNLAQSYRFHTGDKGPVEVNILKPDAKFIQESFFQVTVK